MNRRKFITTCTCCAFASMGAALLNEHNILIDDKDEKIRNIEVHLAEHCNLNCKYCLHFSNIADKEFYDLDKFRQDIKRMSDVFNKKLGHLQLLGGEPLLNPQINEYAKFSRKCFPSSRISIVTNSILLDKMDEKFWETLRENNIVIMPTVYNVKLNWKSIFDKAKKYNIEMNGCINRTSNVALNVNRCIDVTYDNLDAFLIKSFMKLPMSETKYRNIDKSNCCRNIANSMYDGKIYLCQTIANIRHFNKKFNKNFVVTEKDYLDLYKVKNVNEVKDFLYHIKKSPFCEYCSANFIPVKWEASNTHDISEWT